MENKSTLVFNFSRDIRNCEAINFYLWLNSITERLQIMKFMFLISWSPSDIEVLQGGVKIFDLLFAISFQFLAEITSVQCISSGVWVGGGLGGKTRESAVGPFQIFPTSGKAIKPAKLMINQPRGQKGFNLSANNICKTVDVRIELQY